MTEERVSRRARAKAKESSRPEGGSVPRAEVELVCSRCGRRLILVQAPSELPEGADPEGIYRDRLVAALDPDRRATGGEARIVLAAEPGITQDHICRGCHRTAQVSAFRLRERLAALLVESEQTGKDRRVTVRA